jgi:hypothetical protein
LYDGVADTLVSLLSRNSQHLDAKKSGFRIDLLFRQDWAATDTKVQWTRAPIGAQGVVAP